MKKRHKFHLRIKPASNVEPVIKNELNVRAVTNDLKISKGNFLTTGDQIISYGDDNLYPSATYEAVRLSPTAKGCTNVTASFLYGQGIEGQYKEENNDIIVNRWGESLSEVIGKAIDTYSWLDSFILHFNYNLMGEITEIVNVDARLIRKSKDLQKGVLYNWGQFGAGFYSADKIEVFLYNYAKLKEQIQEDGGFDKFKGNIYYWFPGDGIYSLSKADASTPSAQLENEIQIFNYASVKNSFNASGLVKVPQLSNDDDPLKKVEEELKKLKGAENAGAIITLQIPQDMEGKTQAINLFESFQQNNIDKMYVEQGKNAQNMILKEYKMPRILLAIEENGMFNMEQYEQAFDYYNALMQPERNLIEKAINKFWMNTIWASELNKIKIVPLEMKRIKENANNNTDQSTGNQDGTTT